MDQPEWIARLLTEELVDESESMNRAKRGPTTIFEPQPPPSHRFSATPAVAAVPLNSMHNLTTNQTHPRAVPVPPADSITTAGFIDPALQTQRKCIQIIELLKPFASYIYELQHSKFGKDQRLYQRVELAWKLIGMDRRQQDAFQFQELHLYVLRVTELLIVTQMKPEIEYMVAIPVYRDRNVLTQLGIKLNFWRQDEHRAMLRYLHQHQRRDSEEARFLLKMDALVEKVIPGKEEQYLLALHSAETRLAKCLAQRLGELRQMIATVANRAPASSPIAPVSPIVSQSSAPQPSSSAAVPISPPAKQPLPAPAAAPRPVPAPVVTSPEKKPLTAELLDFHSKLLADMEQKNPAALDALHVVLQQVTRSQWTS